MNFPVEIKTNFVNWLMKTKSPSKLRRTNFLRKFGKLKNSNKHIFMQDGSPTHWSTNVSKWLNENLPGRWIGRGGQQDCNISWTPRSPDITPLNYFLWGYIKSKVYVKNYENISDVKAAIISAFQEVLNGKFNHGELW